MEPDPAGDEPPDPGRERRGAGGVGEGEWGATVCVCATDDEVAAPQCGQNRLEVSMGCEQARHAFIADMIRANKPPCEARREQHRASELRSRDREGAVTRRMIQPDRAHPNRDRKGAESSHFDSARTIAHADSSQRSRRTGDKPARSLRIELGSTDAKRKSTRRCICYSQRTDDYRPARRRE